jgi:Protein of unknown function (DUF3311)
MRRTWLLLLAPYASLPRLPFYNKQSPELFGFPFFYWYHLLWVPLTTVMIYLVYKRASDDR